MYIYQAWKLQMTSSDEEKLRDYIEQDDDLSSWIVTKFERENEEDMSPVTRELV